MLLYLRNMRIIGAVRKDNQFKRHNKQKNFKALEKSILGHISAPDGLENPRAKRKKTHPPRGRSRLSVCRPFHRAAHRAGGTPSRRKTQDQEKCSLRRRAARAAGSSLRLSSYPCHFAMQYCKHFPSFSICRMWDTRGYIEEKYLFLTKFGLLSAFDHKHLSLHTIPCHQKNLLSGIFAPVF